MDTHKEQRSELIKLFTSRVIDAKQCRASLHELGILSREVPPPSAPSNTETSKCSRCKKRYFMNEFRITRLGEHLKTCLDCNEAQSSYAEKKKTDAPHSKITERNFTTVAYEQGNDTQRQNHSRYLERKRAGTVDKAHGAICKRDPERVARLANELGLRMVDPTEYKNARTSMIWGCMKCAHHFRCQRQFIHKGCRGPMHRFPELVPHWNAIAEERGLPPNKHRQEHFAEIVARYNAELKKQTLEQAEEPPQEAGLTYADISSLFGWE